MARELVEHRKELIKFAWNHLKVTLFLMSRVVLVFFVLFVWLVSFPLNICRVDFFTSKKAEDSLAKQWAYVNVCRFIAVYETPPKIILQVN